MYNPYFQYSYCIQEFASQMRFHTAQKMKFSIKDLFSNCDQIRRKLRNWSHLLVKSLMENINFCAVSEPYQAFQMKLSTKIVNDFILAKNSILDVLLESEYASVGPLHVHRASHLEHRKIWNREFTYSSEPTFTFTFLLTVIHILLLQRKLELSKLKFTLRVRVVL